MSNDSLYLQIERNRRIMAGLPHDSAAWINLNEENIEIGARMAEKKQAMIAVNNRKGGPAWIRMANIVSYFTYGSDYKDLEEEYRLMIAREADRLWEIAWELVP